MARECMLTTVDNPYSPFDQFTLWHLFDKEKGYNTCEYLARIAHTSDDLTDQENSAEIDRAIDEIIKYDPFNLYKRVFSDVDTVEEEEVEDETPEEESTSDIQS